MHTTVHLCGSLEGLNVYYNTQRKTSSMPKCILQYTTEQIKVKFNVFMLRDVHLDNKCHKRRHFRSIND